MQAISLSSGLYCLWHLSLTDLGIIQINHTVTQALLTA